MGKQETNPLVQEGEKDIIASYNYLKGNDFNDDQIALVFSDMQKAQFDIKSTVDFNANEYAKQNNLTAEEAMGIKTSAETAWNKAGAWNFNQPDNTITETSASRAMEFARGKQFKYGDYQPSFVYTTDSPGSFRGSRYKTHEQIADQRDVVWDKELLKKMQGKNTFDALVSALPFIPGMFEKDTPIPHQSLNFDSDGVAYWEMVDLKSSQLQNNLRSVWGPSKMSRSGIGAFGAGFFNEFPGVLSAAGSLMENIGNSYYLASGRMEEEEINSKTDYRQAYMLQNIGGTLKFKDTYQMENTGWARQENFWKNTGSAVGQMTIQIGLSMATGIPTLGYVYGGLASGDAFNQMAKENNVSPGERAALYAGVVAITSLVEKGSEMLGGNPIEQVTRKFGIRKAIVSHGAEKASKVAGMSFEKIGSATLKDKKIMQKIFMKEFYKQSFSKESRMALEVGMKDVFVSSLAEGTEEIVESFGHNALYTYYDYIHKEDIERSQLTETDHNKRMGFLSDFDAQKSAFGNYLSNTINFQNMAPDFIFGFIGGFAGSSMGLGIRKLSNNPTHKHLREQGLMDIYIKSGFNFDLIEQEAKEIYLGKNGKSKWHFTHTDGKQATGVGQSNLNDQAYQVFMEDLNVVKHMAEKLGLTRLSLSGPFSKDADFLSEILELNQKYFSEKNTIGETQLEIDKLKAEGGDATVIAQKEAIIKKAEATILEIEAEYKLYTDPESEGKKYSKKTNDRIRMFEYSRKIAEKEITDNEKEYVTLLRENKIKKGSQQEKEIFNNMAMAVMNKGPQYIDMKNAFMNSGERLGTETKEGLERTTKVNEFINEMTSIISEELGPLNSKSRSTEPQFSELIKEAKKQLSFKTLYERSLAKKLTKEQFDEFNEDVNLKYEEYESDFATDFAENNISDVNYNTVSRLHDRLSTFLKGMDIPMRGDDVASAMDIRGVMANLSPLGHMTIESNTEEGRAFKQQLKDNGVMDIVPVEGTHFGIGEFEHNGRNYQVYEIDSSKLSFAEFEYMSGLQMYNATLSQVLDSDGKIKKTGIDPGAIEMGLQFIQSSLDLIKIRQKYNEAMENVPEHVLDAREDIDGKRMYNEDKWSAEDNATNKVLESKISELESNLHTLKEQLLETEIYRNAISEIMASSNAKMKLGFWVDVLTDQKEILMTGVPFLKKAGIVGVEKFVEKLLSLSNRLISEEKIYRENGQNTDNLSQDSRKAINSLILPFEKAMFKAYQDEEGKIHIQNFISLILGERFKAESNGGKEYDSNGYLLNYFRNNNAFDLVNPLYQGVGSIKDAFTHMYKQQYYNPSYHFAMNYFHVMINSDISVIEKSINKASQGLKTFIPTIEQALVQKDIQNAIQKGEIDNFVFQNDMNRYKVLIGLVNDSLEPVSLAEARALEIAETDPEQKKAYQAAIYTYESSSYPKFEQDDTEFMNHGVTLVGNAGSGKTEMVGFSSLIYAINNGLKHVRIVVTSSNSGLTSKSVRAIERTFREYNEAHPNEKITYDIKAPMIQDILSKDQKSLENSNIINETDLFISDESGRFSEAHLNKIRKIHDAANEDHTTGFLFLGDNQQIQESPIDKNQMSSGMRVQKQTVHTMPLQYSFRTGNTIISSLTHFWGENVFLSQWAGTLQRTAPTMFYQEAEDGVRDGGYYYEGINQIVEDYIKRNKAIGDKAILIFETQEAFDSYRKLNPAAFTNDIGNVRVLYNNIQKIDNSLLESIQGGEVSEVYIAIEAHDKANRLVPTNKNIYNLMMATATSRGQRFVGSILENSKEMNLKSDPSFKTYQKPTEEQILEVASANKEFLAEEFSRYDMGDIVMVDINNIEFVEKTESAPVQKKVTKDNTQETPESEKGENAEDPDEAFEEEYEDGKDQPSEDESLDEGTNKKVDQSIKTKKEKKASQNKNKAPKKDVKANKKQRIILPFESSGYTTQAWINGKSVSVYVVYTFEEDGQIFVQTKDGVILKDDLNFEGKGTMTTDEASSNLQEKIGKGNFAITPGTVSVSEWEMMPANASSMVLGQIKAAKARLLQGIYDKTLLVRGATHPFKIVYSNVSEEFVTVNPANRSEVISTPLYNQIKVMVNINDANLEVGTEDDYLIEFAKQNDGWVQVGNVYTFNNGSDDISDIGVVQKMIDNRKSKYLANSNTKIDEQLRAMQKIAKYFKGGKVMSVNEFDSILGEDKKTMTAHLSKVGNVPVSALRQVASVMEEKVNDKQKFKVAFNMKSSRNVPVVATADTMTLKQKIEMSPKYKSELKTAINNLKKISSGVINESQYISLSMNPALRMMYVIHNREAVGMADSFNTKARLDDPATNSIIKQFALRLEEYLKTGDENNLFVPAWDNGPVQKNNLYTNLFGITNTMFIDTKAILSKIDGTFENMPDQGDTTQKVKRNMKRPGGKFATLTEVETTENDWGELTAELRETIIAQIGQKEYDGIIWNTDGFSRAILGAVSNGKMYIQQRNGKIYKRVLIHEVFHMVFRHGITAESRSAIIEDYRQQEIAKGNLNIDSKSDHAVEEMMANEHTAITMNELLVKPSPTTLWGKIVNFMNNILDRFMEFFTNREEALSFQELSKSIRENRYANKLNVGRNSTFDDSFLEDEEYDLENEYQDAQDVEEDPDNDESPLTELEVQQVDNMFKGSSSRVIMLKYAKSKILDNTIFNQFESAGQHLSVNEAITDLKDEVKIFLENNIEEVFKVRNIETGEIYDIRTMSPSEFNKVIPDGLISRDIYFYGMFYGLNEHQLDRKLDAFTKTIFPNAKVKQEYSLLFAESFRKSAIETLSRPIKDLLTGLTVLQFEFIKTETGQFVVGDVDIHPQEPNLSNSVIASVAEIINSAVLNEDIDMSDIQTAALSMAIALEEAALKEVKTSGMSVNNSLANQLMTVSRYLYDPLDVVSDPQTNLDSIVETPLSMYYKIESTNNIEVKNALEDFIIAFKVQMQSIGKRKVAKITTKKGAIKTDNSVLADYKSNIKNSIKSKILDGGTVFTKKVIKAFSGTEVTQRYKGQFEIDSYSITAETSDGLKTMISLFTEEGGRVGVRLNKNIAPSELALHFSNILNSIGIRTSPTEILELIANPEKHSVAIGNVMMNNVPSDFIGLAVAGYLLSMQLGTQGQYIRDVFDKMVVGTENTIIDPAISGQAMDMITALWDPMFSNDSGLDMVSSIQKQVSQIEDFLEANNMVTDRIRKNVLPKLNAIMEAAPVYKGIIQKFRGSNFINNDSEVANLNEEFIDEEKKQSKTPSPLQLDILLNVFHEVSTQMKSNSNTEYRKDGTVASYTVQIANSNHVIKNFTGENNDVSKQMRLANFRGAIARQAASIQKPLSMLFNSILPKRGENALIDVLGLYHISEYIDYKNSTTDIEPGDTINAELTAFVLAANNNQAYLPRTVFGDNNHLYMYEVAGLMKSYLIESILSSKNGDTFVKDDPIENNPALKYALDLMKQVAMTHHVAHVNSIMNILNAAKKMLVELNVVNSAMGRPTYLLELDGILGHIEQMEYFTKQDSSFEGKVSQYDFKKNVFMINTMLNELSKVYGGQENAYNALIEAGASIRSDLKMIDGFIELGDAASFNTNQVYDKNGNHHRFTVNDFAYNAINMYNMSDKKRSFMEFNPATTGEALTKIWSMFGSEINGYQNELRHIIKKNKLHKDVKKLFTSIQSKDGQNVIIRSIGDEDVATYNTAMLYHYLFSHLLNKNMNHAINGHSSEYGTNEEFYSRIKTFETPGENATASPIGLGEQFSVAILKDAHTKVTVQRFNILMSGQEGSQVVDMEEITEITNGATINLAIGRMFMLKSFGGKLSGLTASALKPIYSDYNMMTDRTTIIKDSNLVITGEDVLHAPLQHLALEYIALSNFDVDLADRFLARYNQQVDSGQRRDVAFNSSVEYAYDQIQQMRIEDPSIIENVIISFTHPTCVKIGSRNVNNYDLETIKNSDSIATIKLNTAGLRMIFNPDSEIENSRGEVLMKQGYHLATSALNTTDAKVLENALSNAILASMKEIGMNKDGSLAETKEYNDILDKAILSTKMGLQASSNVGTSIDLLNAIKTNPILIQLDSVNAKVIQKLNKNITEASAKLRFNGSEYNQTVDINYMVYDVQVTNSIGFKTMMKVTEHGLDTLKSKFGEKNIEVSIGRKLNEMKTIDNKLTPGECVIQSVNMHKFGIVPGQTYMTETLLMSVKIDNKYVTINIMDINDEGFYNGKSILDESGNIEYMESALLDAKGTIRFDSHFEKIQSYKKSLTLQLYRKPTSLLSSGGVFNIIEYRSDNSAITSSRKIAWDDSDFDIDRLYSYEYSIEGNTAFLNENESVGSYLNIVLDQMVKAYETLAKEGNLRVTFTTKQLMELPVVQNKRKTVSTISSPYSSLMARKNNYEGKKTIDRFANIITSTAILNKIAKYSIESKSVLYNESYNGEFDLSHQIVGDFFKIDDYKDFVMKAVLLQAAVDNAKKAILGDTGLSRNSTNEIVAMLYSGYSMKEITDFMSHPFIKEIYDEAESNSQLTTIGSLTTPFMILAKKAYKISGNESYIIPKPKNIEELKAKFFTTKSATQIMNRYFQSKNSIAVAERYDEEERSAATLAAQEKYLRDTNESEELKMYAYYMLQQFSLAGEIFKKTTFIADVMDGIKSKEYEENKLIRLIEEAFGKKFNEIDFSEKGIVSEKLNHSDDTSKRLLEWYKENNDFYIRTDTRMQPAHLILQEHMNKIFKFANIFQTMPLMNTHSLIHQFRNKILENTINTQSAVVKDFKESVMKKLGIGTSTSKAKYYLIQKAIGSMFLSKAVEGFVKAHPIFGKSYRMTYHEYDDSEHMQLNENNEGFLDIDLTKSIGGRTRFTKRVPSYVMNFGEMINKLHQINMDIKSETDVIANKDKRAVIMSNLSQNYNVSDTTALENSLDKYEGDNFFNYVTRYGENYDEILVIKDSVQLKENETLFMHIQEMFKALPEEIRDVLGLYELILNEMKIKKSSLFDVLGIEIFEKIIKHYPSTNEFMDGIAEDDTVVGNLAVTEGILYPLNKMSILEVKKRLLDLMTKNNSKFAYIKLKTEEKYNNKQEVIKKVHIDELSDSKTTMD
ncbi:MAG: hypothetical protein WC108_00570, partial [Bacteroidales bacterium]